MRRAENKEVKKTHKKKMKGMLDIISVLSK